jgi:hypothetical protein
MTSHDQHKPLDRWRERLRALGWITYFAALLFLLLCFVLLML